MFYSLRNSTKLHPDERHRHAASCQLEKISYSSHGLSRWSPLEVVDDIELLRTYTNLQDPGSGRAIHAANEVETYDEIADVRRVSDDADGDCGCCSWWERMRDEHERRMRSHCREDDEHTTAVLPIGYIQSASVLKLIASAALFDHRPAFFSLTPSHAVLHTQMLAI